MKEGYRKPALPALFGILLGGGMLFLLFLLTSLGRNREAVERMFYTPVARDILWPAEC